MKKILVTGGAGFIGSAVIRQFINDTDFSVVNVDKLTYAGNLQSLASVSDNPRYRFEQVDICDAAEVARVFREHQPDAVMHLAAESHVDRSISGPADFIQTNIVGTYTLLEAARNHWNSLDAERKAAFRFHHISTDEVYGSLGDDRLLHRRNRLRTQFALLRQQGVFRSLWCAPGITPTDCPSSPPTAPTTTDRIIFRRSSSRW